MINAPCFAAGRVCLSMKPLIKGFFPAEGGKKRYGHISEKEQSLIALVAQGLNNREIAEKLFLSEGTVRNYLSNILDKLQLRDRTQLAVFYYRGND